MKPHCERESQFELFETGAPAAELTPKLALPFQRSQEIDIRRVAKILAVGDITAYRMVRAGLFPGAYQVSGSKQQQWRIAYSSVVEYCNRLRLEYRISSRAVTPIPGRRHRDEELLPFPMAETIGVAEVRAALDCTHKAVLHMLDEGTLTGYQVLILTRGCPWRIYSRSLDRYLSSLRTTARSASPSRDSARPTL